MLRGEKEERDVRQEGGGGELGGSGEEMRGIERTWSPSQRHFILFFLACPLARGLITGSWEGLTHHDDSPGLLCRAHAHDGRHADGGSLEVDAAAGKKREKGIVRFSHAETSSTHIHHSSLERSRSVCWKQKQITGESLGHEMMVNRAAANISGSSERD